MTPKPISLKPDYPDPAAHLERAAFCMFVDESYRSSRKPLPAADLAGLFFPGDGAVRAIFQRSAVEGADTTTTGWAAELAAASTGAFLTSLDPESAAAAIFRMGPRVSLPGGREAGFPARLNGAVARPWVGEGLPIAVHSGQLYRATVGPYRKIAAISVLSRELSKYSDAFEFFRTALREDGAKSLDSAVFGQDAASTSGHAGLLHGKTSLIPDVGTGLEAMRGDLAALASAVGTGGSGEVVFVAEPGRAARIRVLAPDLKAPVLASSALSSARVVAVDPRSIVHAVGGGPEISATASADLHMEDAEPAEIVSGTGPTTAAPVISMFQTAQIATRLTLEIAFTARRSGAAAFVDVENW